MCRGVSIEIQSEHIRLDLWSDILILVLSSCMCVFTEGGLLEERIGTNKDFFDTARYHFRLVASVDDATLPMNKP